MQPQRDEVSSFLEHVAETYGEDVRSRIAVGLSAIRNAQEAASADLREAIRSLDAQFATDERRLVARHRLARAAAVQDYSDQPSLEIEIAKLLTDFERRRDEQCM